MQLTTLIVCFSLALAAVAVAFVGQVRRHRATRRLLARLLQHRRKTSHETAFDRNRGRSRDNQRLQQ